VFEAHFAIHTFLAVSVTSKHLLIQIDPGKPWDRRAILRGLVAGRVQTSDSVRCSAGTEP
jgi:hypothetical protein